MKEVALQAGASISTVSRVLSGQGQVSHLLRRKVLDAVRRTGYAPGGSPAGRPRRHAPAPGMKHNTVVLALVDQGGGGSFHRIWEETAEGVLAAADEMGINVTTCLVRHADLMDGRLPPALTRVKVDGIVAGLGGRDAGALMAGIAPTVLVGSAPAVPISLPPVVEADNRQGMWGLVAHLAGLGHKRIEFVSDNADHNPFRQRTTACQQAADHFGMACGVRAPVARSAAGEYARELLARPATSRPTALLASCDGLAVNVLHALLPLGVRVPEQMSVVGFDGRDWASDSVPPLTSWRVHRQEMGRLALSTLTDLIERGWAPSVTLVGGELVIRRSTGPAPEENARVDSPPGATIRPRDREAAKV